MFKLIHKTGDSFSSSTESWENGTQGKKKKEARDCHLGS